MVGMQLGSYRVVERIGEGGMATVYKGYQGGVERHVALKVLPQRFADDPQFVGRFQQEARVLAKLQHPHILPVYDYGETDGYTYIVMPYIDGGSLADRLKGRPLPLDQTSTMMSQMAEALDYAHGKGLVHRDIKPGNVLIDESGNCLLTDFGIAKILSATTKFTSTGGIIGTPEYMSPEQGLGETLDGRSDVYSLGVMLYEMVTGSVPYSADTPIATVMKHIHDPVPKPRDFNKTLPVPVDHVVLKALAKEPDERFSTAGSMAGDLREAIVGEVVEPTLLEVPGETAMVREKDVVGRSRPRWLMALAVVFLLLALGASAYTIFSNRQDEVIANDTPPTIAVMIVESTEPAAEADSPGEGEKVPPVAEDPTFTPIPTPTLTPSPTETAAGLAVSIIDDFGHAMQLIPTGDFVMGTSADRGYAECQALIRNENCQREWFEDEEPVHNVTLDAFYMDLYEVTSREFAQFLNEAGNQSEGGALWIDADDEDVRLRLQNGSWVPDGAYADHPVVEVNWYGARAYCRRRGARLPTEAEWEKAARGTDGRLYPWGDRYDDSRANMCDVNCPEEWANSSFNDGYGSTSPVGAYPSGASPYGLYDMAGNVMDWTLDWYAADSYGDSAAKNPSGAAEGEFRVVRGGSWLRNGRSIRTSYRYSFAPDAGTGDVGFRCVKAVDN